MLKLFKMFFDGCCKWWSVWLDCSDTEPWSFNKIIDIVGVYPCWYEWIKWVVTIELDYISLWGHVSDVSSRLSIFEVFRLTKLCALNWIVWWIVGLSWGSNVCTSFMVLWDCCDIEVNLATSFQFLFKIIGFSTPVKWRSPQHTLYLLW